MNPRQILAATLVAVIAIALWLQPKTETIRPAKKNQAPIQVSTTPLQRQTSGVIWYVDTKTRAVALTFDDGPDPRWTPEIIRILSEKGARATFFVVGSRAQAHPEIIDAAVASGNEIANHTHSHESMRDQMADRIQQEIRGAASVIAKRGIQEAPFFRPPKGYVHSEMQRITGELGYKLVLWDVCIERQADRGDRATIDRVLLKAKPGSILLAHDGGIPSRAKTVRVLPGIIDGLHAKGFEIVPLGELFRKGEPVEVPLVRGAPVRSSL